MVHQIWHAGSTLEVYRQGWSPEDNCGMEPCGESLGNISATTTCPGMCMVQYFHLNFRCFKTLSRGEITIWALTPVFLYFYHFPSYPHVAQRSEHSLAVLFSNNIAARRCVLPGRFKWRLNMFKTLSFNMLKHLHRASVLRFPRRRTLNPKTLNHPKP